LWYDVLVVYPTSSIIASVLVSSSSVFLRSRKEMSTSKDQGRVVEFYVRLGERHLDLFVGSRASVITNRLVLHVILSTNIS
jgi:hypothetical protein